MAKENNLEVLVKEYNDLLDKVDAKWEEIYDTIDDVVSEEKRDSIGYMIADAMYEDTDPYGQLQINYEVLAKEVEESKENTKGN